MFSSYVLLFMLRKPIFMFENLQISSYNLIILHFKMHHWLSEAHICVLTVVLQPHIHSDFSEYQLLALIFWLLTPCPLREKWLMSESLPQVFCIWHTFKPCFTLKGSLSWTQFTNFLSVHQLPSCFFNNCWTFYFLSAVNSMLRAQGDSFFF